MKKITLDHLLLEAEKVWVMLEKCLPFKTKDEYFEYIKKKWDFINKLSNNEKRKYYDEKQKQIKIALNHIQKLNKNDSKNKT